MFIKNSHVSLSDRCKLSNATSVTQLRLSCPFHRLGFKHLTHRLKSSALMSRPRSTAAFEPRKLRRETVHRPHTSRCNILSGACYVWSEAKTHSSELVSRPALHSDAKTTSVSVAVLTMDGFFDFFIASDDRCHFARPPYV